MISLPNLLQALNGSSIATVAKLEAFKINFENPYLYFQIVQSCA